MAYGGDGVLSSGDSESQTASPEWSASPSESSDTDFEDSGSRKRASKKRAARYEHRGDFAPPRKKRRQEGWSAVDWDHLGTRQRKSRKEESMAESGSYDESSDNSYSSEIGVAYRRTVRENQGHPIS